MLACRDTARMVPARVNILGAGVNALDMPRACSAICARIAEDRPAYVCVSTVHCVMEAQHNVRYRRILNDSYLTTPDGMPLVWVSRAQGYRGTARVYGPDLMLEMFAISETAGYRHFLYGGAKGVADQLAIRLAERFPNARIVGTYSPPFRELTPEEDDEVVRQINESGADLVWVGLGTPKQDFWMASHLGRISAAVMLGVGAAFDFHAGRKKQAPRWMQRSGLEWLFRLLTEPRRLWFRYLIYNPLFVVSVIAQLLGLRHYTLDVEDSA